MKIETGTVSHGTLRPEDLIPAFYEELKRLNPIEAKILAKGYNFVHGDMPLYPRDNQECVNDLIDLIDSLGPNGMYFGAHIGDGSDFGWWYYDDEEGWE